MQLSSSDNVSLPPTAESLSEDDIDRTFQKLQKHEPPAGIVDQILQRIRQLPAEQIYQPSTPLESPGQKDIVKQEK